MPQSKRQAGAAETYEQLLAAAQEVFESRGYQAATVGAVTSRASTAHGTFYLYFRNKEDAFAKVMERTAAGLLREASSAAWESVDRYDRLERSIRAFLGAFAAHRGLWRCLLEGSFTSPAVQEIWLEVRRSFIARLEASLRRLADQGVIRPVDPCAAANALGAMVEWSATMQFVFESSDGSSLDETARTLADLWFHAVYLEAGGSENPRATTHEAAGSLR